MDCIGTAITMTLTGLFTLAAAPLALIGFSKSNYHRFCYYKHHLNNLIADQRKKPVNKDREIYHKKILDLECERSKAGLILSKINIFNLSAQALYATARFIAAPAIYLVACLLKKTLSAGVRVFAAGIQALGSSNKEAVEPEIIKVRERLAELNQSLDCMGHLPATTEQGILLDQVSTAANEAKKRSFFQKTGFTLFSEGRKVFSLGHTYEERILFVFKDKFEQYLRARARKQSHGENVPPVSAFFKTGENDLPNHQRFLYKTMVDQVLGYFSGGTEEKAINGIADLLKSDLEACMNSCKPG